MQLQRNPALDKNLKCIWLNHGNPYLKLGPWNYEWLHQNPEIALVHNLISENESLRMRELARGKMKSTPYTIGGEETTFSKGRTSKVMYMNEKRVPIAMAISKKIELATRFKLSHEQFASENFQVMNYGIGGKISGHTDSAGEANTKTVSDTPGKKI